MEMYTDRSYQEMKVKTLGTLRKPEGQQGALPRHRMEDGAGELGTWGGEQQQQQQQQQPDDFGEQVAKRAAQVSQRMKKKVADEETKNGLVVTFDRTRAGVATSKSALARQWRAALGREGGAEGGEEEEENDLLMAGYSSSSSSEDDDDGGGDDHDHDHDHASVEVEGVRNRTRRGDVGLQAAARVLAERKEKETLAKQKRQMKKKSRREQAGEDGEGELGGVHHQDGSFEGEGGEPC